MKNMDRGITVMYWIVKIGWVIAIPVGMVGFFAGGFFVWIAYLCLWDWVRDLREDHKALQRTATDQPLSKKLTREVDWGFARTRDAHPATVLRHHDGTQDIGNINGFQDLGYPVQRVDVRDAYPTQMQCQDCSARFEPPYPATCPFCGHHGFAIPSLP